MTTMAEPAIQFEFSTVSEGGQYDVSIDGRPLGYVIRGHYGWLALDVANEIVRSKADSKQEAAEALWKI